MTEFQDIDKTLAFIRDHAPKLAKATAERIYLDNYKKSLFSKLFTKATHKTMAEREAWALQHDYYNNHLKARKIAIEEEETIKWQMTSAELRVEVWRSQEATNRSMDRSHT